MEQQHIVSFSGGKDSTAMLLMMIEKGMQIDDIVFCDTGVEFSEMYKHIKQVEDYIGEKITVLKGEYSFEYYLFEHKKKSKKNKELGYGFPRMITNRWCTDRLKEVPFKKHIKRFKNPNIYLGIAYDEKGRAKEYNYPLIEWEVTEAEALQYCYDRGFDWGGLYELFDRVSCWCCPMQTLKELKNLYINFPEEWETLKRWEKETYNNFRCDYTMLQLEKRFEAEESQIEMFV